ncbi:hypothetical protein GGX14DRAFT_318451, partial [Mycena pura]
WDGWPNGVWERTYSLTEFQRSKKFRVKWACSTPGTTRQDAKRQGDKLAVRWQDGKRTRRFCLGIIKCDQQNCKIIIRPHVRPAGLRAQLEETCPCGGSLQHYPCGVESEYWLFQTGAHFKHNGTHYHERPTNVLHLTTLEEEKFANVVEEHPKIGPVQLLTGLPGIDGPGHSVAEISSALQNPQRIKYERRKVLGPAIRVRDQRFIPRIEEFKRKHPRWNVDVYWSNNIHVVVLQSPWQRRVSLKDVDPREAVNGIVSDACHNYWAGKNELLFLSSTFEPRFLKCWVPVLMSYSNGASAEHYRIHFLHLFRGLARQCDYINCAVDDELFANVVDFSDAQRNGFILAFVDFWTTRAPNERTEQQLRADGAALLKGCKQHFENQITRVSKISRVVAPDKRELFRKYAYRLLKQKDMVALRTCADEFIHMFPLAKPWIEWWMRPTHAPMLFLASVKMSKRLWDSLPATTNAEEAMHERFYRMIGRQNSMFYGMAGLVRSAETFERSYNAARVGVKIFYGKDPQYWKATRNRYSYTKHGRHELRPKLSRDGRAPDTIAALGLESPKKRNMRLNPRLSPRLPRKSQSVIASKETSPQASITLSRARQPIPAISLQPSYRWSSNSCWLDASLTALYAACGRNLVDLAAIFNSMPQDHLARQFVRLITLHTEQVSGSRRALSYFRAQSVQIKRCGGSETAPVEHWELARHPNWKTSFTLSRDLHEGFGGDLRRWFTWLLDPMQWSAVSCWRQIDSLPYCHAEALAHEYILNIPIVYIIEMGEPLGQPWTIPSTLFPLGKQFAKEHAGMRYDLVAEIYTNYTEARGAGSHFITRYNTADGAIYDYDSMIRGGCAVHCPAAEVPGWLSGPSQALKDLPGEYTLCSVVYNLAGGAAAQDLFRHERRQNAPWGLTLRFN